MRVLRFSTRDGLRRSLTVFLSFLLGVAGLTLLGSAPASASVPAYECTGNTIYALNGADPWTIYKLNSSTGAATENGELLASGTHTANALALPNGGGRYIYGFDRTENTVLRFDATNHGRQSWAAPANSSAGSVIAGAINPQSGIYYYASSGSSWKLFAFNISTSTALGQVGTISGSGLSSNGDIAFDALGNMYVVSNADATAAGALARVNGTVPTTAGSAALTVTKLADTPAGAGQYTSMAFDGTGALVIGAGSRYVGRVNPTTGAILSSTTTSASFVDFASCAVPSTAQAQVSLPSGRYDGDDQFVVSVTGSGVTTGNTGTTAGTDSGLQDDSAEVAGPVVVLPGSSYTITQTGTSTTNLNDYTSTWACVKASDGSAVASGTGSTGTFTMPGTTGTNVVCTFTNVPLKPGITLTKTGSAIADLDGNGPDVGDTITYGFKVTNTGVVTLSSVGVSDPKLGTITCPTGTLAAGASRTCTSKTYTLTQADVDAGKVDNTATASGTGPTGTVVTATDSVTTAVTANPAISLVKGGTLSGSTITYTFTATNTGNVTLQPVTVTDTKVGTVTCPTTAVAPGASISCSPKTYTLTQADRDAGKVDNTATATGTAPSGTKVTAPSSVTTTVAMLPAVDLTKTASTITDRTGNGVDAGDTITYSFKVANTGNVTLQPVTVADAKVGAITCPTTAVAPGASVSCSPKTYTLTQADVDAGKVDNTATATGTAPSGTKVTDPDSTSTVITSVPAIALDKSASAVADTDGNGIDAGDTITYSFKVTNTGSTTLQPVTVADAKVGAITCPTTALLPGANVSCTQKAYTLTQADVDAGKVENTATATGTAPSGAKVTDADTTTTLLTATAAIELDKTAGSVADSDGNGIDVGDTVTYSFKVANTGNLTLQPVTVTDAKVGTVTCPTTALVPGASLSCSSKSYTLTQADVDAGKVDNTATATGTTPTGAKVTGPDSTSTVLPAAPALDLDKSASAIVDKTGNGADAGDTITYSFKVTNLGNVTLTSVGVSDDKVGTVTCPGGPLVPGASATCTSKAYTITQAEVNAGKVDNTATATGTAPSGTKLTAKDSTSTAVPARPELTLVKSASAVQDLDGNGPDAGDTIAYSFKVTNTGNLPLNPVTVADPKVGAVTCPTGELAPGASISCGPASYTLTQDDVNNGKVDNTATATGTTPAGTATPGVKVTSPGTVTTPVATAPAIDLVKAASAVKDLDGNGTDAGDTITYSFSVTNVGTVTLNPITVADPKAGPVTCPTGALAPGESVECTPVTYTITQDDVTSGAVVNTATATGTTPAGTKVTDSDTVTTPVVGRAALSLQKKAGALRDLNGNGPDAGDTIEYSFTVTNTGTVPLHGVTVADPKIGPATCASSSLEVGEKTACGPLTWTVTDAELDAGVVKNTATARGNGPDGTAVTGSDSTTTPVVRAQADLAMTKTVDKAAPRVGDTVTYTLKATNKGVGNAEHVVLRDTLPTGVTLVSAQAPCTVAGATVTCELGTLAGGASRAVTVTATVDALPTGPAHQHLLDVQKQEVHVDLEAGQTRTVQVSCAPGYVVTDGSGRIDHVDQGTGSPADVRITESRATAAGTWQVTMTNQSSGRAQGKAFEVCVSDTSETVQGHQHALVISDPVTATQEISGRTTVDLSCTAGQVPIQPGYLLDGVARVLTSTAKGDTGWTWTVEGAATSGDFSMRCLSRTTSQAAGHAHPLGFQQVRQSVTVEPGQTVEVTVSCASDAKGVVAGYDAEAGLVSLGNDPRPVVRVFKFLNPTSEPLQADLFLQCLSLRNQTGAGANTVVVNTATASTTSPEASTADNASSARIDVDTSAPTGPKTPTAPVTTSPVVTVASPVSAAALVASQAVRTTVSCATGTTCVGTATLVAVKTVKVGGRKIAKGTVLAKASYRVKAGKSTVRLVKTKAGKKALGKLGRARLVVGGRSTVVKLKH
ncbi:MULTISPECIES: DUF7507 domain-containing protein [unclassified Nocardioides]|uniref:DUF7507 domain-containing protein n=1 Tax=unclassified Nocardioides TaxID=2615069 RepID=UPI0030143051